MSDFTDGETEAWINHIENDCEFCIRPQDSGDMGYCYSIHQPLSLQALAVNMRLLWIFLSVGCLLSRSHALLEDSIQKSGELFHRPWEFYLRETPKETN